MPSSSVSPHRSPPPRRSRSSPSRRSPPPRRSRSRSRSRSATPAPRRRSQSPRRQSSANHRRHASSSGRGPSQSRDSNRRGRSPTRSPTDDDDFDYKAAYHVLLASNANKNKRKRTTSAEPKKSPQGLGRGIRKVAALFGEIVHIIAEAQAYERNPLTDDHGIVEHSATPEERAWLAKKRNHERNYEAYRIIDRLLPDLKTKIAGLSLSDKADYFVLIQKGANDARSDDFRRVSWCMGQWINEDRDRQDLKAFDHTPPKVVMNDEAQRETVQGRAPLLDLADRSTRGVEHDITGGLLTTIRVDWNNKDVREACRNELTVGKTFFFRVFYEGFKAQDPTKSEPGFLRSRYLVKSWKAVFTSPSSADKGDEENAPPRKKPKATRGPIGRSVAAILGLNGQVTPRSIAYIAVLVWVSLTTVSSWNVQDYYQVSLHQLYDFIVDFLESPAEDSQAKERVDALLAWWNQQVFPSHGASADTNKVCVASRDALWEERAALEAAAAEEP